MIFYLIILEHFRCASVFTQLIFVLLSHRNHVSMLSKKLNENHLFRANLVILIFSQLRSKPFFYHHISYHPIHMWIHTIMSRYRC